MKLQVVLLQLERGHRFHPHSIFDHFDHSWAVGHEGFGLDIQITQELVVEIIEGVFGFAVLEQFHIIFEVGQDLPVKLFSLAAHSALHHFLTDNQENAIGVEIIRPM